MCVQQAWDAARADSLLVLQCHLGMVMCMLTWCAACVQVGPTEHAICALSGGVDSTVAATLIHKVLGDRLHCVFVDNGLLRLKVGVASAGAALLGWSPTCACLHVHH